jgi:hypothetical protein
MKLISSIPTETAKKLIEFREYLVRKHLEEKSKEVDKLLKNGLLIQTRKRGGIKC